MRDTRKMVFLLFGKYVVALVLVFEFRFVHYNDDRNLDVAFAQAIKEAKDKEGGNKDKSDFVPIDSLLSDLPSTGAGQAVKKAVRKSAAVDQDSDDDEEDEDGKKKRKKKRKKDAESKSSLRLPAPLSGPEQERTARAAIYQRTKEDVKVWDAVVHSSR